MVLTDPGLIETELVHRLQNLEVTLKTQRRALLQPVERRQEYAVSHCNPHVSSSNDISCRTSAGK
jgi:hypothetical protein